MKPGQNGELTFESTGELDVLRTGLDVIKNVAGEGPVGRAAEQVGRLATDMSTVFENVIDRMSHDPVLGSAMADAAPCGIELTLGDPEQVAVARMAVSIVAANEPGSTNMASLQDPLVHDMALGMAAEYREATGEDIFSAPTR